MPEFKYTARTAMQTEQTGTVHATNEQDVRTALEQMGLTPVYIQSTELVSTKPDAVSDQVTHGLKEQWLPLESFDANKPVYETQDESPVLPADSSYLTTEKESTHYFLSDTIRLYAGWLIAWYGIVYILGFYQKTRELNPEIPYVHGLLVSPLVLTLAGISFTFLLTHSLTRTLNVKGIGKALVWFIAIGLFVAFRMQV